MGKKFSGIYRDDDSSQSDRWQVDKWFRGERIRQRGFHSQAEAEDWLTAQLAERRHLLFGKRPRRTFDEAAAKYILDKGAKNLPTDLDVYLLGLVMPYIGHLEIGDVDQDALDAFVAERLREVNVKEGDDPVKGRGVDGKLSAKTINLAISLVGTILNRAADTWKHSKDVYWLERPPRLVKLDLEGKQRPPHPITWREQADLMKHLPRHLKDMTLFCTNTGARDNVVCQLRWSWEIKIPQLGNRSLFIVPPQYVKGGKKRGVIFCNSAAQEVVERCRGKHPEFVFVYRRERIKNLDAAPSMPYRPVGTMNNTGWQAARSAAGLGDLHVHDLRHTFAMRLREGEVQPETRRVLLWHGDSDVTEHYTAAQILEVFDAVEKVAKDAGVWNRTLDMLLRDHRMSSIELEAGDNVGESAPRSTLGEMHER